MVTMYHDDPGVFMFDDGSIAPDDIAASAGFEVEELRRKGDHKRRIAEAQAELEREFAEKTAAISEEIESESEAVAAAIEDEVGNAADLPVYNARHKGRGRYSVFNPNGEEVASGLDKESAEQFAAESNAKNTDAKKFKNVPVPEGTAPEPPEGGTPSVGEVA